MAVGRLPRVHENAGSLSALALGSQEMWDLVLSIAGPANFVCISKPWPWKWKLHSSKNILLYDIGTECQ